MLYRNHIIPPIDQLNRFILLEEKNLNLGALPYVIPQFCDQSCYKETI